MMRRIGRYAATITVLALTACGGGSQPREEADNGVPDVQPSSAESPSASDVSTGSQASPSASGTQDRGPDVSFLGFDRGSKDAPVRVLEMSDYGCGYCRQFHMQTWPVLKKEFVETGKVEWKFLPFVIGMFRNSQQATTAAECALEQGPAAFEAMNHRLWADQKEWKSSSDAAGVIAGWVDGLGLDADRYRSCVSSNRRESRIVAANTVSRQLGVRGTPTFFIMGYAPIPGALPTDVFRQVLNQAYEDATKKAGR
ncbi:MAG: DsbA family protein [Gemmatimonadetes bacterium]|nr:DsbA family protein [Gemmatimonadota bacterium]